MTASIGVLRGGGLGDAILALPALRALRTRFADAHIAWVGTRLHRELMLDRSLGIDEVISLPSAWQEESLVRAEFIRSMQQRRFSVAIQLHGGGAQSNPFVAAWQAETTVGMAAPGAISLDRTSGYLPWQHEVFRFLDVIDLLDAPKPTSDSVFPSLPLTADESEGDELDLLVVHPGARDPRRRWPVGSFIELLRRANLPTVLIGTRDERPLCAEIAAHTSAVDLCGALDLSAMIRLIAHARLVVANDSGPRHVAEAVGTPTVSMYWIGNLVNAGPLTRTAHSVHVSWQMSCPQCQAPAITGDGTGMARCGHEESWVSDVAVEPVLAGVRSAWEQAGQRPRRISLIAGRTSSR